MIAQIEDMVDRQAEAGVVATMLIHPEFMLNISYMRPGFFYDVSNGCIYWAIQELINNGVQNIDALNITNQLNSNPAVRNKMEEYNITSIQEYIDASQYAARDTVQELQLLVDNVVTMAFKRSLYMVSTEIGKACRDEKNTLSTLNSFVNQSLESLTKKFILGAESVQFGEKVDSLWDEIVSERNDDGSFGIPSVIPEFEKYFSYAPAELVLVAGETGKGKSAFFLNETIHKLKLGVGVLYIDTEMSDKAFLLRALANLSGVTYSKIRGGTYSQEEKQKVVEALRFLRSSNLIHEYLPEFDTLKIEQLCRKWQLQSNIGFVIYDYIKPERKLGTGSAEVSNGLGLATDFLKNKIAGELNLPVLAGAQMNANTKQLADSQKPLRYCSTFLNWREKTEEEITSDGPTCGNYCVEIGKNRNGMHTAENSYIDINFDGGRMRIRQADQHVSTPIFT